MEQRNEKKGVQKMQVIEPKITPLTQIDGDKILLNLQRAAKTCYKSYKTTDDVESAKRIVKSLINSNHHAMLEFETITMNYTTNIATIKDCSRHRHGSFAIESSRFCNYSNGKFDNEIKFLRPIEIPQGTIKYQVWLNAMEQAEKNYMDMAALGGKPDELSLMLPQSTACEMTISCNIREWRHILALRAVGTTGKPRACVQEIMIPTLRLFAERIPVVFDDLLEKLNQKER